MPVILIICALEPLAEALRWDKDFTGIQIKRKQYSLSLFANEIVLYIQDLFRSLSTIEKSFNNSVRDTLKSWNGKKYYLAGMDSINKIHDFP